MDVIMSFRNQRFLSFFRLAQRVWDFIFHLLNLYIFKGQFPVFVGVVKDTVSTGPHYTNMGHHQMLHFSSFDKNCNTQHTLLKQFLSEAPIYVLSS